MLKGIHEYTEGKALDNPKKSSGDSLKAIFAKILPDYDRDAVYVSDIKKIFSWYNLLLEKEILEFTEEETEEAEATENQPEAQEKEKPEKKE